MEFQKHTKEEALLIIKGLVERFRLNEKSYKNNAYDESNTRTDFIDKFFEALNWDVRNDNGDAEQFRDVVREDKVSIEGKAKAPDYSFRIKGTRVFFVEAKKPSVNIKNDVGPAYQVRRYAYTAKLPISILTDFEEFAIYETNKKPNPSDAASKHRPYFFTYNEYEEKFDFLWETLSYDAVRKGSLDRFCDNSKRGTGEIDVELLATIEQWRIELAKNIALRNPDLSLRNLNTAVQKIIDRIVFLRIAEDKDMEEYETLKRACGATDAYKELRKVFDFANKKYNSGLFASEDWLNNLVIDSKVLKDIASELYYPICPYAWVALPIEILGNIYEKFLGSEITFRNVKGGHTVQVEQKPEVKKAGGVYYTPQYIVEYIVKQTVARKLEGKSIKQIKGLTICDPACGSGSFLVGAYKYLMDWHLTKYSESEEELAKAKKQGNVVETSNGLSLSLKEKQRILTTHIYGVDIDAQAVEVTKLSLFLQMLDGEGKQYINNSLSLFRESDLHVLPNLGDNIKCGNSLIGSDFYANQELNLFDDEAIYKINAFDWDKEFSEIFKNGGFECVIGNPPYVLCQQGVAADNMVEYYKKYKGANYKIDLYHLFIEKAIILLKDDGLMGFITPNTYFTNKYADKLRNFILNNCDVKTIVLHDKVFELVAVDVATTILIKTKAKKNIVTIEESCKKQFSFLREKNQNDWENDKGYVFNVNGEFKCALKNTIPLGAQFNTYFGIQAYDRDSSISDTKKNDVFLPIIDGEDIRPFSYAIPTKHFDYQKKNIKSGGNWNVYKQERVVVRQIGKTPIAGICNEEVLASNTLYSVWPKTKEPLLKYLLCILNSTLISNYWKSKYSDNKETYPKIKGFQLKELPIPNANSTQQQELANLADQMMVAVKKQHNAVSEQDKRVADTLVSAIDNQINQKVYELYGITDPNDIAVIEGKSE